MPAEKTKKADYKSLDAATKNGGGKSHDQSALKSPINRKKEDLPAKNLANPNKESAKEIPSEVILEKTESVRAENYVTSANGSQLEEETTYAKQAKQKKREKKVE